MLLIYFVHGASNMVVINIARLVLWGGGFEDISRGQKEELERRSK